MSDPGPTTWPTEVDHNDFSLPALLTLALTATAASARFNKTRSHWHENGTSSVSAKVSSTAAAASTSSASTLAASTVPGGATTLNVDFSTYSSGSVVSFLSTNGLSISDYSVDSLPLTHSFTPNNVAIVNGALTLTVRGGPTTGAEISSNFDILYGSITTRAQISTVAGTCSSSFFYKSDNDEIDIEMLTSYVNTGYEDSVPAGNQPLVAGDAETNTAVAYGFDPTAAFHDYTVVVWTSGSTEFYIDGVLKTTFTANVPQVAGPWVWNNWSSGDPEWTAGPPTSDNVYQIQSITGYYTT